VRLRLLEQRALHGSDQLADAVHLVEQPQAQRGEHLLAPTPPGDEFARHRPGQFGQARFDRGEDIARSGPEAPPRRLIFNAPERRNDGVALRRAEDARFDQRAGERDAGGHLSFEQPPVRREVRLTARKPFP
jgi:hypothetical protein